jgi:ubiquinone biosynthesis accessory factor UbiK
MPVARTVLVPQVRGFAPPRGIALGGEQMMDNFRIDEIARRLLDSLPPAFRTMSKDLETNFRAVLRSSLGKLDLVTRDEFDTQTRVLERTRARLAELEARLQALEGTVPPASPADASRQPSGPN